MSTHPFHDLQKTIFALYTKTSYQEALELALEARERFPERRGRITYWIGCLESRLGDPDRAILTFQEGLERGHWWSERHLRRDPDLQALQDRADFQAILSACERRRRVAQDNSPAQRELLVFPPSEPSDERPYPLLLVLHGRSGTAKEAAPDWEAARSAGLLLTLPQSSQISDEDVFGWDDEEMAEKEITTA